MNRRLFWKIWLGFSATYFMLSYAFWLYWSLHPSPADLEWDPPHVVGAVLSESAATALQRGGPEALEQQMASWPQSHRERLVVTPLTSDDCTAPADPRMIARPVSGPNAYCLRYATPPLGESWIDFVMPLDSLIGSALAGLVFSAALAWYLTRPIHRLRQGFDCLARGDLKVRLGAKMGRRRDEVADLAHDFDRMAERLQELVGVRDRLLHDVSHEVRSPLARMRLATSLLRQDPIRFFTSLDRIDREADQLDALVGELLTLAKHETGAGGGEQFFDLLDVVHVVLEGVEFEAAGLQVTVNASLPVRADEGDWLVSGSGLLAHRAIENIMRNALRFSRAGDTIDITLNRLGKNECVIWVDDCGPGVDAAATHELLKPFVQGTATDGAGFGLGLAIAQRAIATCRGTVTLANRTPCGLRVTIALPLAHLSSQA